MTRPSGELVISAGFQGLGVSKEIIKGLRLYAEAADQDVSSRGRQRIHLLLTKYKEPRYNKVGWKQKLAADKEEFEQLEQEKSRWRALYKSTNHNEACDPREYDAKKCPDMNYCTETVDGKTWGINPFREHFPSSSSSMREN